MTTLYLLHQRFEPKQPKDVRVPNGRLSTNSARFYALYCSGPETGDFGIQIAASSLPYGIARFSSAHMPTQAQVMASIASSRALKPPVPAWAPNPAHARSPPPI